MDQLTTNLQSNAPSARPTETPLGTHETDAGDLGERHDLGSGQGRKLELAMPDPLVENILLEEVAGKSAAANLDLVEAEQTVIKARAAYAISKLEYVPTVAAVSGFLFQNVIPAVSSSFGYRGVFASYNLFDFGKR